MTRPEIIELVKVLTERKLESVLNFNSLYTLVLQDFCGKSRFWWRQMAVAFSIAANTPTYDTTADNFAAPSIAQIAVEEITEIAILNSGTAPTYLSPVLDPRTNIEMRSGYGPGGSATPAKPSRYMMDFNDFKTLRFDSPDAAYNMMMTFWAMPDPRTETANDTVPLVPPWHHKAIVFGMETEIWRTVYGPKNDKYLTSKGKYDDAAMLAQARPRFTTNASQQLVQSDRSVQST